MRKLVTALATLVLMISLVPVSAAAKKITVYYPVKTINYERNSNGKMVKYNEETVTYTKKGMTKKWKDVYYSDGKKSGSYINTYKFKKGRYSVRYGTSQWGKETYKSKSVYSYKGKNFEKQTNYTYDKTKKKYVKSGYSTYKWSSKQSVGKFYDDKGKLTSKYVDTYNKKGRLTSSKNYDGNKLYSETKYTYNKKGLCTKEVYTNKTEGSKNITTNTYNKRGECIKSVYKNSDGSKSVWTYKYSHDKHGNINVTKSYNGGKLVSKRVVKKFKKFVF